jgi:hypothetical protein
MRLNETTLKGMTPRHNVVKTPTIARKPYRSFDSVVALLFLKVVYKFKEKIMTTNDAYSFLSNIQSA